MRKFTFTLVFLSIVLGTRADRIYIINAPGYNEAGTFLLNAITALGHTVTVNTTTLTIPSGFACRCDDPVNGYDWLCFFGEMDYTSQLAQIKTFLDCGGKVYYQYEVSCCTTSSASAATVASGLTGLTITTNAADYIAINTAATAGYEGYLNICDTLQVQGNAYKCMDGVPATRQFIATANLGGSYPPVTDCSNFGFWFATSDFLGTASNGWFMAIGDVNMWYLGNEPGSVVDNALVAFVFPMTTTPCTSCIDTTTVTPPPPPPPPTPTPVAECILLMPNTFTPNGDLENNTFHPINVMSCIQSPLLRIYDRWGNKLYETNDLVAGWNGQHNGKACSDGTYFWILEYGIPASSERQVQKGFVNLIE